MPKYDYHCDSCEAEFETVQSIHDQPLSDCPHCHKPQLRRLISGAGVIFKGSGFYVNDSKKNTTASSDSSSTQSKATPASTPKSSPSATSNS